MKISWFEKAQNYEIVVAGNTVRRVKLYLSESHKKKYSPLSIWGAIVDRQGLGLG